jgi:hypothetical protein
MNARHSLFFPPPNSYLELASLGAWYVIVGWVALIEVSVLISIWPSSELFVGQIGVCAFLLMGLAGLIEGRR